MAALPFLPPLLRERLDRLESILNAEPFFVLIWGSGVGNPEDFEKRVKIRGHLTSCLGPNRVFMSEDPEFRNLVAKHGERLAELLEVGAVDSVVVLDTSPGPHTEVILYENSLIGKTIVFVKQEYKDSPGFAAIAYEKLKVEGFTKEEYTECETIRRRAHKFVTACLYEKVRHKLLPPLDRL